MKWSAPPRRPRHAGPATEEILRTWEAYSHANFARSTETTSGMEPCRLRGTMDRVTTAAPPAANADLEEVADLISGGDVMVLSGAGISTESGIPDYRGPTGSQRPATP